jgi:hypothetical protein
MLGQIVRRNFAAYASLLAIFSVGTSVTAEASVVPPRTAPTSDYVEPDAPFPDCGDHFAVTRSGQNIHVVGVDLYQFSRKYMLVFTAANGRGHGPYNASPYGGANFYFDSGSYSRTTISISLTNHDNTVTLCAGNYYD